MSLYNIWINPLTANAPYHIETSPLICSTNKLTGFYIMRNTGLQWVNISGLVLPKARPSPSGIKYSSKEFLAELIFLSNKSYEHHLMLQVWPLW